MPDGTKRSSLTAKPETPMETSAPPATVSPPTGKAVACAAFTFEDDDDFEDASSPAGDASSRGSISRGSASNSAPISSGLHAEKQAQMRASKQSQNLKICPVLDCGEKIEGKRKFCKVNDHNGWYESTWRRTFPDAKKRKRLTNDETEQLEKEQESFKNIFGSKDKDGDAKLMSDYFNTMIELYGDSSNKGSTAVGTSKGKIPGGLSAFTHSLGPRKVNAEVKKRPKWDKEVFMTKMKAIRPWGGARCNKEWGMLKNHLTAKYRRVGTPRASLWNARRGCVVRNTMLRKHRIMMKCVWTHRKKAIKMGQSELDRAVSDCQVGFGVVSRADDQASMNPVCSSSVTNDSGSRKRIGDVRLEA